MTTDFGAHIVNIDIAQGMLGGFSQRRLDAALATSLTRTAREIEGAWLGDIFSHIDRPTPFTMKSVIVQQATAKSLKAEVFIRDQPTRPGAPAPVEWMATNEEGGSRYVKKFERALIAQGAMPAGMKVTPGPYAKLDEFGNISRGQIVQVITQLGGQFSPGYARVISPNMKKRMASAARLGREYVPVLKREGKLEPGVYQKSGRELLPVFWYVKSTHHRKITNLRADGLQVGSAEIRQQVNRAIGEHIVRLQAKGTA